MNLRNYTSESKIILTEDSDEDYDAFMFVMGKLGLRDKIVRFSNGEQAINLICKQPPDSLSNSVMFLDLNLPGINGKEVIKKLRSHPLANKLPIIIFTTSKLASDINECYELGANSYLDKPMELHKFTKSLQRVIEYWFNITLLPFADLDCSGIR